jgi:hypothetical protein
MVKNSIFLKEVVLSLVIAMFNILFRENEYLITSLIDVAQWFI